MSDTLTHRDSHRIAGYIAGIASGIAYGMNPLFGLPLMTTHGMSVDNVLFYRYFIAMLVLGGWLLIRRQSIKVHWKQLLWLILLGILFASSSLFLFEAYYYVPSGVATTIVFLYPVLVALIMVILKVYPTWQTWIAIAATFVGVILLCHTDGETQHQPIGYVLSAAAALSYAIFIVIINRCKTVSTVSNTVLTFYSLVVGSMMFFVHAMMTTSIALPAAEAVSSLLGLALIPTIVSTATLASATRYIGATKASVLGVFEPVTAIVVGVVIMGEPFNQYIVIGLFITMAAIIFMTVSERKKTPIESNPS